MTRGWAYGTNSQALEHYSRCMKPSSLAERPVWRSLRSALASICRIRSRYHALLADFFQRVIGLLANAEAHAQNLLLARRQRRQHLARLLAQIALDRTAELKQAVEAIDSKVKSYQRVLRRQRIGGRS
jgi:hypothetical protein